MSILVKCLSGDFIEIPLCQPPTTVRHVKEFFHDTRHIHPSRQMLFDAEGHNLANDHIVEDDGIVWLVLPEVHPLSAEYLTFLRNLERNFKGEVYDIHDLEDLRGVHVLPNVKFVQSVVHYFDQHARFFDPTLPNRLVWDSLLYYDEESHPYTVLDELVQLFLLYNELEADMLTDVLDTVVEKGEIVNRLSQVYEQYLSELVHDVRMLRNNTYIEVMVMLQQKLPSDMTVWEKVPNVFESEGAIVDKLRSSNSVWSREELADLVKHSVLSYFHTFTNSTRTV